MHSGEMPRQQGTAELLAYWRRIRGKRAAPNRSDVDPAQIRQVLCDSFMIEADSARHFPMRLAGARLDAFCMQRQKDASFLALWSPQDRRSVAAALLSLMDCATPISGVVRAQARGFSPIEMELLLLPLRSGPKSAPRILGALIPDYQPGWVGQVAIEPLELLSLRMLESQAGLVDQYRDNQVVRADRPPPRSTRPTLVVLEGGRSESNAGTARLNGNLAKFLKQETTNHSKRSDGSAEN